MIPQNVEIFVALEPVNMHLAFDRLAGLVTAWMGRSARDPALYIFLSRRRTLLKALFFDGSGYCITELDRLQRAYEQVKEELLLVKRRLFIPKAERVDTTQLELEFVELSQRLGPVANAAPKEEEEDDAPRRRASASTDPRVAAASPRGGPARDQAGGPVRSAPSWTTVDCGWTTTSPRASPARSSAFATPRSSPAATSTPKPPATFSASSPPRARSRALPPRPASLAGGPLPRARAAALDRHPCVPPSA